MLWTVEAMTDPTPCGTKRCAALVSDGASLAKTNYFRLTTTSLGVLGSRA